jgi:hypothetical protein
VHVHEISRSFPYWHHISARQLKEIFDRQGWDWFSYRRFCVVRNPYDRVVSLYHFKLERDRRSVPTRGFLYNAARRVKLAFNPVRSFAQYVDQLDPETGLCKSLDAFIGDGNGHALIDDVLRFETLRDELPRYVNELGICVSPADIPHLNSSHGRAAYRDYYADQTKDAVARLYAADIERFGYSF